MNEHLTRGPLPAHPQTSISERVTAVDVDRGIKQSLDTGVSNQYAMTFEATDESGKKVVSAYVKKAGRSLKLNEAAMVKGGLALLRSICVRSSWEKPDQIKAMYEMLPDDLKRKFIESRGDDFRVFTAPADRAIYLFIVLFKSGEKWMGEGIAYPGNVKNSKIHCRMDELAETRAFNRCVGRGLADGFINQEQVAGSEPDDDDLEDDDETFDVSSPQAAPIDHVKRQEEAAPDGDNSFRTPDRVGETGTNALPGGHTGAEAGAPAEAGTAAADTGESVPAASTDGGEHHAGDRGPDVGTPKAAIEIVALMNLARSKNVFLLKLAQERCGAGIKSLNLLTDFQRSILYDEIKELPDKPSHKEG